MTDTRSQALARESRMGLDPQARVAHLAAWLRADPACSQCEGRQRVIPEQWTSVPVACESCHGTGTERRWRVELAAYLGDEAARAVLGPTRTITNTYGQSLAERWPGLMDVPSDFGAWARGLSKWGRMVCVRAAIAAARLAQPTYVPCPPGGGGSWHSLPNGLCGCGYSYTSHVREDNPRKVRSAQAIEAAERWALDPSDANREASEPRQVNGLPSFSFHLLCAVVNSRGDAPGEQCAYAIASPSESNPSSAAHLCPPDAVRLAIREALVPWLLDDRDSIRERHEARSVSPAP